MSTKQLVGVLALAALAANARTEEKGAAAGTPAAIVAGQPIAAEAVDALVRPQLMDLRMQQEQLRTRALDALIAEALFAREAQARGISDDALEKAEVLDKSLVTDAEARAYYEANKGRFGEMTESQALARIRSGLGQQRQNERRAAFAASLRSKYEVKVLREPYRVPVEVGDAPVRGNPNAPVTVVEFSDFQCPFCERARPTVARVRELYGDKVRWVYRHFPLSFHERAEKAAEAAACAGDQGRFWEMHDRLWANNTKLQVPDLEAHAAAIGLDAARFEKCLDSGAHAGLVARDEEAGASYGVSGTPAFFVNGRPLVGAQPLEAFRQVIDDELQRKGVAVPVASASR